jgi:hypothetical protein
MAALDLFLSASGHAVVAEVIETEFGIGAVGNVAIVLVASNVRVLIVENAADGQAKHFIHGAHPLTIASGQIIVDGNDMNATSAQRVEIDREGGDERFAFAGGHFRDPTRVQAVTADELDVKRNHLPLKGMAPDGDFLAAKPAAGIFDDGKSFGQNFVQTAGEFLFILNFGKLLFPTGSFLAESLFR